MKTWEEQLQDRSDLYDKITSDRKSPEQNSDFALREDGIIAVRDKKGRIDVNRPRSNQEISHDVSSLMGTSFPETHKAKSLMEGFAGKSKNKDSSLTNF